MWSRPRLQEVSKKPLRVDLLEHLTQQLVELVSCVKRKNITQISLRAKFQGLLLPIVKNLIADVNIVFIDEHLNDSDLKYFLDVLLLFFLKHQEIIRTLEVNQKQFDLFRQDMASILRILALSVGLKFNSVHILRQGADRYASLVSLLRSISEQFGVIRILNDNVEFPNTVNSVELKKKISDWKAREEDAEPSFLFVTRDGLSCSAHKLLLEEEQRNFIESLGGGLVPVDGMMCATGDVSESWDKDHFEPFSLLQSSLEEMRWAAELLPAYLASLEETVIQIRIDGKEVMSVSGVELFCREKKDEKIVVRVSYLLKMIVYNEKRNIVAQSHQVNRKKNDSDPIAWLHTSAFFGERFFKFGNKKCIESDLALAYRTRKTLFYFSEQTQLYLGELIVQYLKRYKIDFVAYVAKMQGERLKRTYMEACSSGSDSEGTAERKKRRKVQAVSGLVLNDVVSDGVIAQDPMRSKLTKEQTFLCVKNSAFFADILRKKMSESPEFFSLVADSQAHAAEELEQRLTGKCRGPS